VDITYVFAGISVADRDVAAAWYTELLGKPPDFLPHDGEAVWQLTPNASLYVVVDAERAGQSVATLAVDDLEALVARLEARNVVVGEIEEIPGAGRKAIAVDVDGNAISMVEILAWQPADR
jgi:hypothetical protein